MGEEELYPLALLCCDNENEKETQNLSFDGKLAFAMIILTVESWATIKDTNANMPEQEKLKIIHLAYKNLEEEIVKFKLQPGKKYNFDLIMAKLIRFEIWFYYGKRCTYNNCPIWVETPINHEQGMKLILTYTNHLNEEERKFLINFFKRKWRSTSGEGEEETQSINKYMANLFEGEKLYKAPSFWKAKELLDESKKNPEEAPRLQKKFVEEYSRKQLTPKCIYLIEKAFPEIILLYSVASINIRNIGPKNKKIQKCRELTLSYFENNSKSFSLVKQEYLENEEFYKKLKSGLIGDQFKREFFGWIMNRIFEANDCKTLKPEIIIKEVRKLEKKTDET